MARLWYRELQKEHPRLASIADRINADQGYSIETEREKHHQEYRKQMIERRESVQREKYRRRMNGEDEGHSSSSSGDLIDSDWTSLSETFSGLRTSEEEVDLEPPTPQIAADVGTEIQSGSSPAKHLPKLNIPAATGVQLPFLR